MKPSRRLAYAGLATALICASAYIAVPLPFTPVPITLQTAAIAAIALTMPPTAAITSAVAYVLLGAAGIPVFAGGAGGLGALLGPTGGFIAAFPLMAAITAHLYRRLSKSPANKFLKAAISAASGNAALYVCGTAWFCVSTTRPPSEAAALCVLPYLIPDAFKTALSAFIAISADRALSIRT